MLPSRLHKSCAASHTIVKMNKETAVAVGEISAALVSSLSPDEIVERMRSSATPFSGRASHFDHAYKFQISPMSIPLSMQFLRSLSNSSTNTVRIKYPHCRLEDFPNEVLLNMVKFLDIASLKRFAACNTGMRRLITSMPHVQIVKSHAALCLALSRMLRAGTAKYFTLQRLIDTATTPTCMACKDSSTFAPWICLLLCQRFCTICISIDYQTIRIPKTMAVECLDLTVEELGMATVIGATALNPSFLRTEVLQGSGLQSLRIVRHENKIDIISLRHAIKVAVKKHAAAGGPSHVKLLIERYLHEHHPNAITSRKRTAVTKDCKVRGLIDGIQNEWQNKLPTQDWALMAYVPYLRSAMPPPRSETGVLCDGCFGELGGPQPFTGGLAAKRAAEKVYLMSQYLDHFEECQKAQTIFQGERLTAAEQNKLKASMIHAACRFQKMLPMLGWNELLNIAQAVQLDASPLEVRDAVANALFQIQKIGNRRLQEHTSSSWQTVSEC